MKILYYNLAKQWRSLIKYEDTVHYFYILKGVEAVEYFRSHPKIFTAVMA